MNAAAEARLSELDRAVDAHEPSPALAAEIFAVADLLGGTARLRNALADPTAGEDRRRELATGLFGSRISATATAIAAESAVLKWGGGSALVAAIERAGVRVLLGHAQRSARLDAVEDELFRFSRAVVADPALRQALDDRTAPVALRQQLVRDLLAGKADDTTIALAERATASGGRSIEATIADYLKLAAAVRQRAVASVTVARPLSDEQRDRLQAALERQLGRPVNLQVLVDPDVLGGGRVQIGDEVIEGTIAGRLTAAEQQLTK